MEPPDPFPNSEVKRLSADGSVVCPCESRSSSALYLTPLSDDEGVCYRIVVLSLSPHTNKKMIIFLG